jgi:hypothetical protein
MPVIFCCDQVARACSARHRLHRAVVELRRVLVHRQQREPDIVVFGDGPARAVFIDIAHSELLEKAAIGFAVTLRSYLGYAITHRSFPLHWIGRTDRPCLPWWQRG